MHKHVFQYEPWTRRIGFAPSLLPTWLLFVKSQILDCMRYSIPAWLEVPYIWLLHPTRSRLRWSGLSRARKAGQMEMCPENIEHTSEVRCSCHGSCVSAVAKAKCGYSSVSVRLADFGTSQSACLTGFKSYFEHWELIWYMLCSNSCELVGM